MCAHTHIHTHTHMPHITNTHTPDLPTPFSVNQNPRSRTTSTASGIYPTFLPDSSITLSFNLPSHSLGMGIQSPSAYSDKEDETKPKKLLIFHGIILRSQLVMMMKNHIYFHEDHGVRQVFT